jgi:c-di-GMP phosphodiesterase
MVVEILEAIVPTPAIVAACADLRAGGDVLALDDFVDHPKWQPLLPVARFLKVDLMKKIDERWQNAICLKDYNCLLKK